ncbi:hypothetical protein AUJ46_06155 [Candidatus Peregrinibacteria bacterium CG1_02_54_53]|nr:MAG: hypothetical protein AUJ46_06155 [Candidatus Peregrinibacteria bacterium CG1_02_54_53]
MADFADSDFLYFDPETRAVIGPVQWTTTGNVQPLEKPTSPDEGNDRRRRGKRRKECYLWGSYRSLKHLYNLEGKRTREEQTQSLDEVMTRAMREPYWD